MVQDGGDMCCRIILCGLALICPPLAVMCHRGCDNNTCVNILLTCLLVIPGVIHALYVICTKEPADASRTTVVTVVNNNSAVAGRY